MRCDLCFDSFCMMRTKLILEKKFLQENSLMSSISSPLLSFVKVTEGLDSLVMLSSGLSFCLSREKWRQYWKKLQ